MTVTSLTDEQVAEMSLLPCPFCGGKPGLTQPFDDYVQIDCDNCALTLCTTFSGSKAEAIVAWNTRAPSPELTDLRERLGSLTAETSALKDVAAERQRQIEAEGWTPEHDDQHRTGQMADAAARYAVAGGGTFPDERTAFLWPWAGSWWKPGNKRRSLVKAGALILAEIERLDRLAAKGGDK